LHDQLRHFETRAGRLAAAGETPAVTSPPQPTVDPYANVSFSQFGEDLILRTLFEWDKLPGLYVDVGAHHPRRFSNTHALHLRGWRGINIDADEQLLEAFVRERPGDINVTAAVSDVSETVEMLVFPDPSVNTLSPEKSAEYERHWSAAERRMVLTQRLDTLLDQHLPAGRRIDLLSIDVEGLDLQVLSSNDWERYRPRVVLVEVDGLDLHNALAHPVVQFMIDKGYMLVAFAHVSAFFVERP
jgi:FkbM family methyltransferase